MIKPDEVCHEVFYTNSGSLGDCYDPNLVKITKYQNVLKGLSID
jgi:hypothetical protein